jgi:hypothetical protein
MVDTTVSFGGPASTWACLSWHDAQGNVPGNPPTMLDHAWNPNATKIVIPISDEGPYGGDPAGMQTMHSPFLKHTMPVLRRG